MTQMIESKQPFTLAPSTFQEAMGMAQVMAKTELVPKYFQGKPEAIVVAMAWGAEIGLPGLQAVQNIAVINGRPSIWGDAALALAMSHPAFDDIQESLEGDGDARRAVCSVQRKGRQPVVRTFSMGDARRARLLEKDGPWRAYPDRMLQMRARGFALRDAFPDALRGLRLAEEVQDIEEKDVTPERPEIVMPSATKPVEPVRAVEPATPPPETVPLPAEPVETAVVAVVSEGEVCVTAGMVKMLRSKLREGQEPDLLAAFGVDRLEAVPARLVNEALNWIKRANA